jgi:hypothetical protein
VFAAPQGTGTFQTVPRALADSVNDLRDMINGGITNGLRQTNKRAEARIVVEVTSREDVQGELRVHVHVTADGLRSDRHIGPSVETGGRRSRRPALAVGQGASDEVTDDR